MYMGFLDSSFAQTQMYNYTTDKWSKAMDSPGNPSTVGRYKIFTEDTIQWIPAKRKCSDH